MPREQMINLSINLSLPLPLKAAFGQMGAKAASDVIEIE